jgi:hypothetical protein
MKSATPVKSKAEHPITILLYEDTARDSGAQGLCRNGYEFTGFISKKIVV